MNRSLEDLKLLYWKAKTYFGFNSDAEFMAAWKDDPITWAPVFSIRMELINKINP